VVVAGALAVADAATQVVGKPAALKWPNDVLVGGKKVSGILAEFSEQNGRRRTVLGIGLNVNFDPASDGVPDATGLATAAGSYLDREQVAAVLLTRLDAWYSTLMRDADLVFAAWAGRLETVGASVLVLEGDARWNGEAIGVERSGALIVRTADGTARTVLAADVSIRKTGSFTTP
jgi:BirA family biotin operon repressor/biotin-[acetyl-CoA-carboxylase] ligase